MGTAQLLLVFLAFILFGYFVLTSFQRDEQMLTEDAKKEMFDDMLAIGNLANEHYYNNLSDTTFGEPDVLETLTLVFSASNTPATTSILTTGIEYEIKVSGLLETIDGYQVDAWSTITGGVRGTYENYGWCNWRICFPSGTLPVPELIQESHVYIYSIIGTGSTLTFQSGGCPAIAPDNIFEIEVSKPAQQTIIVGGYGGFIAPTYLLNRPYSTVTYNIINDTLIQFTGHTIYEPEVVYERYCTPSNSMGL